MSCDISINQPINYGLLETSSHQKSPNSSNSSSDGVTDSNNNSINTKMPFSFGKCKICSDKATGIHYGIATCEGCKVK